MAIKNKRYAPIFLAGVLLLQLAISTLFPTTSYALPPTQSGSREAVERYNYYSAIYNCIRGLSSGDKNYYSIEFEAKNDGNNLDGLISKSGSGDWTGVGYYASSNGRLKCAESAQTAVSQLGVSPKAFIEVLGYTLQTKNEKTYWVSPRDANGNYLSNSFNTNQKMADNFKSWAAKNNIPTEEPPQAWYYNAKAAFESPEGCNATSIGLYSSASDVIKSKTDNRQEGYRKITVVSGDGTSELVYRVENINKDNVVAYPRPGNADGRAAQTSCNQIINSMGEAATRLNTSRNEAAYNSAMAAYVEALAKLCPPDTPMLPGEYANCKEGFRKAVAECSLADLNGDANRNSKTKSVESIDTTFMANCIAQKTGRSTSDIKTVLDNTELAPNATACEPPLILDEEGLSCIDPAQNTAPSCAVPGVGWIICPVVNFLAGVADMAYNFLADNFLSVPAAFFNTSEDNGTWTAWRTFVSFANAAFVIVFLFIIYSHITGGGWSNYTLKKLLPRFIISAILVNVSFFICAIAVDLSNILGYTIKNLLTDIVARTGNESYSSWDTGAGWTGIAGSVLAGGALAAGGVAAAGGVSLALVALLGMLVSGVIALLMIFFILVVRQVLIILLIVIAPLAFVAFLLPNTEGLFKKWRKTFTAMLILFPLIGLIYGASALASNVITATYANMSDGTGQLAAIIGAGVMVLPLFVIPGLLKKSLDAVGSFGGKIASFGAGMSKKGREKVGNTDYAKFKKQESINRRNLTKSGAYSGRNPLRKGASALYGVYNRSPLSGDFGQRRAASGVALVAAEENKAVDEAKTLISASIKPGQDEIATAQEALTEANKSGDEIKARAAAKILLDNGSRGAQALHDSIHAMEEESAKPGGQKFNSDVSRALRRDVKSANVKGKDNALATWSYVDDPNITIASREADRSTYKSLNPNEIVGQSVENLKDAIASGAITQETATRVMASESARGEMTDEKADLFQGIISGTITPGAPRAVKRARITPNGNNNSPPANTPQRNNNQNTPAAQPPANQPAINPGGNTTPQSPTNQPGGNTTPQSPTNQPGGNTPQPIPQAGAPIHTPQSPQGNSSSNRGAGGGNTPGGTPGGGNTPGGTPSGGTAGTP